MSRHIVGLARKIEVYGNGALLRHRLATIDCLTGDVKQVTQYLADSKAATTDLAYFENGNLRTVTGPLNKNNQRYALNYEYDPAVATHVAKITDSFNLTSSATHNVLFGRIETTTETNGNQSTYFYDAVGRVDKIVGPYEQGQAQATIDFDYSTVETGTLTHVPYAITRHVDKEADGNDKASGTIDTVLFTDGLKRVLQTKKDVTVLESSAPQNRRTGSAVNPEIHVLPGNLKDARDTVFPYFWGTEGWSSPLHLENVKGPANYASLVGAVACLLKNPNLCTDTYSQRSNELEVKAVTALANLLFYHTDDPWGVFTMGGTISNLYGARIGIEKVLPGAMHRGLQGVKLAGIVSEAAHYSNRSIAGWLGRHGESARHPHRCVPRNAPGPAGREAGIPGKGSY